MLRLICLLAPAILVTQLSYAGDDESFTVSVTNRQSFPDIARLCNESRLASLIDQTKDDVEIRAQQRCDGDAYRVSQWSIASLCESAREGYAEVSATFRCRGC